MSGSCCRASTRYCSVSRETFNESRACRRWLPAVGREDVALQEEAGQRQPPEQVVGIAAAGPRAAADQEPGQRQQPVTVRLSRRERDGAAGARADIGEVVVPAGDGAAVEVETVTEVGQNPDLPTHIGGDPQVAELGELHRVEQGRQTSISLEPLFWDALREEAEHRGLPLNALIAQIDLADRKSTRLNSSH